MEKAASRVDIVPITGLNLRFERKFVYTDIYMEDILRRVLQMPFGFKEAYHKRKINNIYLDDANYNFYKQNVEGVAHRKKLRYRWYGDDTNKVTSPNIEVKIKNGEVGDKLTYKFKDFSCDIAQTTPMGVHKALLAETLHQPALHNDLGALHPTLLNTYERRYFLSFCGHYRITIDFNQQFFNPNYGCSYKQSGIAVKDVVVELKYATVKDEDARAISQYIGTRLSKNSKYVNGINLLYHPEFY